MSRILRLSVLDFEDPEIQPGVIEIAYPRRGPAIQTSWDYFIFPGGLCFSTNKDVSNVVGIDQLVNSEVFVRDLIRWCPEVKVTAMTANEMKPLLEQWAQKGIHVEGPLKQLEELGESLSTDVADLENLKSQSEEIDADYCPCLGDPNSDG